MKTQSNSIPEPNENAGRGHYYANMNVHEIEIPPMEEGGDPHIAYEYDCIDSTGYPTYGSVVTALIRERYTESDELAIQRQRDTKPEAFQEYNDFCEACKAEARPVFFPVNE